MGEVDDKLVVALLHAASRLNQIHDELRDEKVRIKTLLRELEEAGAIDLEAAKRARQVTTQPPRSA